jgi:soluble lytic murein transglycosylase-like protein
MSGVSKNLVILVLLLTASISQAASVLWKVDTKGRKVFYNLPSKNRPSNELSNDQIIALSYSKKLESYSNMIQEISTRHGVDAELVKAVIQVESNYNDRARSPKGACGLMQLMPATAQRYGVQSIFDPSQNIEGGVRYLKDLVQLFKNDMRLAVAAYNAGEGAVQKYNNEVPNYEETQNYVRKVLALYNGDMSYAPLAGVHRVQTVTYYKYVDARGVTHYSINPISGTNLSKVTFSY